MNQFFENVETLEDLKQEYKRLAMLHHPDCGGDTATMQAINAEYETMFQRVKNIHRNKEGATYTKETNETPEQWRDIITRLLRLHMVAVQIEVIGSFLWVSGNTRPYKEELKKIGLKWSNNKSSWYLSPDGYKRFSGKDYSMDDIRGMYGSQRVREDDSTKAIAKA